MIVVDVFPLYLFSRGERRGADGVCWFGGKFLPAATVGSVPTVFVGWVVGWVCKVACLLEFFVSFICACFYSFDSYVSFTLVFLDSLGMSCLIFFLLLLYLF